jgi:catechol 2,3-dioxygenase-like lactoylglutathione lyase family enzyme
MIQYESLGHINIVVDDADRATAFYTKVFGAVPVQDFPHFKNVGFAWSAGFLDNPEAVDVTIRFLRLPTPEGLMLELKQYHHPAGIVCCHDKGANGRGCVGHIALRIKNIDEAFEHLKKVDGVRMINASSSYRPFKIDTIQPDEFRFYDETMEQNAKAKEDVCRIVGAIRYFYFLDPYGVQWELEQGHTDIGSE